MTTTWSREQKTKLKQRLYRAALRLFRDRGYEATTVQLIAQRAGVAKGTFFNYFPSKDDVLREWYQRLTLDVFEQLETRRFESARQAITALVGSLAASAASEPKLCAMKTRSASLNEMLADDERALDAKLSGYLQSHIEAGISAGEFDPDLDAELFAAMIVTTMTGTSDEWGKSSRNLDLEGMMRTRLEFLFRAAEKP